MQERRRILVVEDYGRLAKLIAEVLELAGWQVVGPIGRLTEAIAIAASGGFEAALLDVNLGGEAVYPIAEVLNERKVPFTFLTGYDAEALQCPFCEQPRLGKPFKPAELIDTVARLVTPAAEAESLKACIPPTIRSGGTLKRIALTFGQRSLALTSRPGADLDADLSPATGR
jgi:DNA-binding response OmpR family regulator